MSSGRTPRTVAIGPSTGRITSAADLRGRPAERVSALDAAPARDELRVAQVEQDALEELLRDPLGRRELLALDELPGGGELEHRAQRVVDLGGDAHAETVRVASGGRRCASPSPGSAPARPARRHPR